MQQTTMDIDLVQRDPNNINDHIKVQFHDILAEVDGAHSADCIWTNGYKCFNGGKNCCYKFLTFVCGLCLALYWGCCFACVAFEHAWCCTPSLGIYHINCGALRKYYSLCMDCCVGPCCETIGLCFSKITVTNK